MTRYRARGAVREVGKALGVPEDITGALAKLTWGWSDDGVSDRELAELNLSLALNRLLAAWGIEFSRARRQFSQLLHQGVSHSFCSYNAPLSDRER